MYEKLSTILCGIIIGLIIGVGYCFLSPSSEARFLPEQGLAFFSDYVKKYGLPSQSDMQRAINFLEPENPIEIDCVTGEKSREKWDRICGNQSAAIYFDPNFYKKDEKVRNLNALLLYEKEEND